MTDWTSPIIESGRWPAARRHDPVLETDESLGNARAGMRFFLGEMPELIDRIGAAPVRGRMIAVCNVHMLVSAGRDPALADAMRGAAFSICDGQPVAWLLSLLSGSRVSRITGPDVFETVLSQGRARIALVGGDEATLARLAERLPAERRRDVLMLAPGKVVEGDGPSPEIVRALNDFAPRIVFVGLGCPKQEKWMAKAIAEVPATFLGVGAAFDYGTGEVRRAPKAMQVAGGEWIYRLIQQPRLARRYFGTLLPFLGLLARGLRAAPVWTFRAAVHRHGEDLGV